ncbi:hypothetical protein ECZU36_00190 [Escherichia coli]|nr:hypothetical protein ECZU36_00190 [Escherichia coli]
MMWNFDSADLSAIAAGISAFGTLAAAGRRFKLVHVKKRCSYKIEFTFMSL